MHLKWKTIFQMREIKKMQCPAANLDLKMKTSSRQFCGTLTQFNEYHFFTWLLKIVSALTVGVFNIFLNKLHKNEQKPEREKINGVKGK